MFEGVTSTTIVLWIVGWLFSQYVMPRSLGSDKVKKAIKVVDQETDIVETDEKFDWKTAPSTVYRPFKPIYHVTMGITKSKESDYLKIENTYSNSTRYRKHIADTETSETCLVAEEPGASKKQVQATEKAVEELYDYIVQYSLKKYQMYFVATGNIVTNLINNDEFPRYASKRDKKTVTHRDSLRIICNNVEEDFLVMQLNPSTQEYELRASTGIGANGFRSSEKMNSKSTDIHQPVPQYSQRSQVSMNRHFSRIEPKQFTQRLTWGIHLGKDIEHIFMPSGQHLKPEEEAVKIDPKEIDVSTEAFVRVERQVLTKLPKSKFIVLSMHTYMYPLADIKKEGNAPLLAKAIRAWPDDVAHYKGRPKWEEPILAYLEK